MAEVKPLQGVVSVTIGRHGKPIDIARFDVPLEVLVDRDGDVSMAPAEVDQAELAKALADGFQELADYYRAQDG
jgi:hypothetical protein